MGDTLENKHLDRRVAHRYLRKGILDEKDYERHLKGLPDLADQAVPVEASIEGEDLDDEEEDGEDGDPAARP
ncbi:MAG TPA: hypothetical protein VML50_18135 [Anaeromyxobacter sp.]|nr:hypothetical protein [Anaeromyxobacter sp.]